jgi:hypothetical protein
MTGAGGRGLCRRMAEAILVLVLLSSALVTGVAPAQASVRFWAVYQSGQFLHISYGSGRSFPEYATLQMNSGFLRMTYSSRAGWGASASLLPALWSTTACRSDYCQGAPVSVAIGGSGAGLVLTVDGTIARLRTTVTVTLAPPARGAMTAHVFVRVAGSVPLDSRPGEAFKPVMLSAQSDAKDAFTGTTVHVFPARGWIIQPPVTTRDFGLQGATASTPTIEVIMNRPLPVTGWAAGASVGLWSATTSVMSSWSYTLTAESGSAL